MNQHGDLRPPTIIEARSPAVRDVFGYTIDEIVSSTCRFPSVSREVGRPTAE
jgi:hypothetical protein